MSAIFDQPYSLSFIPGQRVLCIDDAPRPNQPPQPIEAGKTYTVEMFFKCTTDGRCGVILKDFPHPWLQTNGTMARFGCESDRFWPADIQREFVQGFKRQASLPEIYMHLLGDEKPDASDA